MRRHRPPKAHACQQHGFTLIELLIVLAVAALLASIAVPTVSGAVQAVHAADARSSLVLGIVGATNQALITNNHAVLCPSADGTNCSKGSDWSDGWIAFTDNNEDREHAAGEFVIQRQGVLAGKVRLTSTVGRSRLVFQANGGNAGSNATFTLCDGRGPAKARTLVLSNHGHLRDGVPNAAAIAATCRS